MLRRRFGAVSKHEGPSPCFETRVKDARLRMRSVGGRQATYGSFLIAQDTLTVTCSVSSPCATAAPDTAMGAATLR
jgi:hypothetical protein